MAIYDTLNHQIGGFSQQQGSGGSITFTSQYGTVNLASLPMLSRNGQPVMPAPQNDGYNNPPAYQESPNYNPALTQNVGGGDTNAILSALEKLGDLKSKGILSDDEFAAKKADLLSRL